MKFKDDYGKDILILDEENLIYKGFLRRKTIKREDIRSVFYDENILGVLSYSGKIYSLNIVHLLFSERKKLEELRLKLSETNLFFYDMLILDEKKLIYTKYLKRKTIKKEEIRSVFYDENILGILTYSGKIYSFNISRLLSTQRKRLEDLRVELNKENILFNYTNFIENSMYLLLFIGYFNIINIFIIQSNYSIIIKIFLVITIIFSFVLIKNLEETTIYNIDKEEVEIFTWKTTLKYKKYEIDKIKVMKVNNTINSIVFKKNKNNFKLYFRENPYLIKIYNTSLTKLFN
ncbi:MAG: hypothetical protein SPH93_08905 [Clostridium sp.]|uniref:hypothetical protein n=1 Tax=Clostridium sp. TaxID=1506 RepID=UPI002A90B378|nr:hypothetical protein [Clostridium sp.]MDY6227768.1 hypothetical protein [Clostridium sp.]